MGLSKEQKRLSEIPTTQIDLSRGSKLQYIIALLNAQIPIDWSNIEKTNIIIAVLGLESPGTAA
jgi:hypothetical protein